ncbi:dihydroxyacetone kinase phosphoryl donor subunit DhaM [Propionicicella superfundia]|uniref:dihydroxyacetone kinase phosphoryl donor subunit DhaM n=1 Tax=Propionicicella superfundia TaxID=348582 RepID=UPI0004017003|nr:dihydroxyacetone kinase phosphoryl donor subunit DhaM [Propionicicella superfundia]
MIGLVVVSHSHALAKAAVGLASEMIPADSDLAIAIAAGLDDVTIGTDAAKIEEAILEVDSPDGVLVFLDLGSAILSAELALEFLDPDVAERVRLTPAPLVEGLVAAVVTAAAGGTLDEVEAEARAGASAKAQHLGGDAAAPVAAAEELSAADRISAQFAAPHPHGLHARPAAALVAALRGLDATVRIVNLSSGTSASARSVTQVAALGALAGDQLSADAAGPDADAALEALTALAAVNFGDPIDDESPAADSAEEITVTENAGTGMAVGPVHRAALTVSVDGYVDAGAPIELERSAAAHAEALAYLNQYADDPIFVAQSAMLDDPELVTAVEGVIRSGVSAPRAWQVECQSLAQRFESLATPYLRERAADVRCIERLMLLALTGQALAPTNPTEPSIVVIDELDAATAKSADAELVRGFITLTGGRTGHGILVASGRGIPVVAGVPGAAQLRTGDIVAIDATQNTLLVNPDDDALAEWQAQADTRLRVHEDAMVHAAEPAVTRSGVRVLVEANVASLADAATGQAYGAEGSGLVRTELLFAEHPVPPSIAEQAEVFVGIGEALGGRMITIRTWDVGGDKPLPFLPQEQEENPFLGERGVRTMRRVPELFRDQLAAIVEASKRTPVRVLVPMVTNPDEVRWVRRQLDIVAETHPEALDLPVGIMVEVPAVAVRASDFRSLVDFVSVGTNDLTQYALAVDRGNATVAELAQGAHPAVFDLIEAAHHGLGADVPIAVCGDLASDPAFTTRLIECGVTELSVQPLQVPLIKRSVRAAG